MISYLQPKSTYKLVSRNATLNLTLFETVKSLDKKKICMILVNASIYYHCQIFFSQSQIFLVHEKSTSDKKAGSVGHISG